MNGFIKTNKEFKYSKVLLFIEPQEEKKIKQVVKNQSNLIFAKDFNDFQKKINQEMFIVFSIVKANNWEDLLRIIRAFPDFIFHELTYSDLFVPKKECLLEFEKNVKRLMWQDDIIEEIKKEGLNIQ